MSKIRFFIIFLILSDIVYARPHYVTTIQPFKMIMMELVGDAGDVDCLLPPGSSPHTYELRPSDVKRVENATAFIMGGKHLDVWAYSLNSRKRIELMHYMPESLFLPVVGVENHGNMVDGVDHHHGDIDPHFWTDPFVVKKIIPGLLSTLKELDPANASIYEMNAARFDRDLDLVITYIESLYAGTGTKPVILSHLFFQYFLKRFDIKLIDVIEKVPGKDPSPRELTQIIHKANQSGKSIILTHAQLPDRAARIIAESIHAEIVELDPLGGTPNRLTYGELINYNAEILARAFKGE